MTPDQVKKLPPFDRLLYWIRERESIRWKRALGLPPPWTDDPILRTYRFCNVRRMDDRVSQWLYKNWYRPHKDHPNMLAAVALARFVNLPSTLETVGFPDEWDPVVVRAKLQTVKSQGCYLNGAYVVCGEKGVDKVDTIVTSYVQPLVDDLPVLKTSSMEGVWTVLRLYRGFGSFMAGQVVADLRWALTGTWKDRHTWAPLGPGSLRGLKRLYAGSVEANLGGQAQEFLTQSREEMKGALPPELTKRLEAMDYQNCLCEFDKYERALWDKAQPKQRYRSSSGDP